MSNVLSKVAVAAAVLLGSVTSANAFVILTLKDITGVGGSVVGTSVIDAKTCDTSMAVSATNCGTGFTINTLNNVSFFGAVGDFLVESTNGSTNAPGTGSVATANTSSTAASRTDGAAMDVVQNLVVDFIAFTFTSPSQVAKLLDGSASHTSNIFSGGDAVNTTFSVDSAAGTTFAFGPTITNTSCLMLLAPSGNCDSPQVAWSDPVAGFSTRTQQVFQFAATSNIDTSSRLKVTAVPEPISISLVGAALLGLGLSSRRRNAAKA